jgi:hypothetical protein
MGKTSPPRDLENVGNGGDQDVSMSRHHRPPATRASRNGSVGSVQHGQERLLGTAPRLGNGLGESGPLYFMKGT